MAIRNARRRAAREAFIYTSQRAQNPTLMTVSKYMYFADRYHLEHYGRTVTGDRYIAMKFGPVPSAIYDEAKEVRRLGPEEADSYIVHGKDITVKRDPDTDYLSQSDIEALDWALKSYGQLTTGALIDAGHDAAWQATESNQTISAVDFTIGMKDREALLEYLSGA